MIAIVDYGSGNVSAISNIYKQLKIAHIVTGAHAELINAERYILPGVGAFDATMRHLNDSGLLALLNDQVIGQGKKVLGICVGMQILADTSEEGELAGLGWVSGHVRKIDAGLLTTSPKLPHMGWNSIQPTRQAQLFKGVDAERGFYFLHNYYFDVADNANVTATVEHGRELPCAVARNNVFGMQFHPEKSHANGVTIFRNFAEL